MSHYPPQQQRRRRTRGSRSGFKLRLMIAAAIVLFSVISYVSNADINPVTGEKQRVGSMSIDDEIRMGLTARAEMAAQHQGLSRNEQASRNVTEIGYRLLETLRTQLRRQGKSVPYPFEFHLLADNRVVNAFALPGGQVFITEALYDRLENAGQLAGVLGHEIGHVLERHGAQRMAKGGLIKGIVGAAGVAGGDASSAQTAAMVGNLINMKYGRDDELESDRWGVTLMVLSGYDPQHMIGVMDVLEESAGGGAPPEFMSTHPRPENRRKHIRNIIDEKFPNGLPPGLK